MQVWQIANPHLQDQQKGAAFPQKWQVRFRIRPLRLLRSCRRLRLLRDSFMMASEKFQYLRCAASARHFTYSMYAAFIGICGALILNCLLCHPGSTFYGGINHNFGQSGPEWFQ
jgi:hypothetical protein